MRVRAFAPLVAVLACTATLGAPAVAAPSAPRETGALVSWIRGRSDLTPRVRRRWEAEIRRVFGPASRRPERQVGPELGVARAILSSAIFIGAEPEPAVAAAFEGWQSVEAQVPPPIAVQYARLTLQGQRHRARPMEFALEFPEHFSEEVAPDLVAEWVDALKRGRVPDAVREATLRALDQTRSKMRPLLLDRLRLLARLDRELRLARGVRRAEIERDLRELEEELARGFERVSRRPEVLDRRKRAFDRLRIELEDRGLTPTVEDRYLDPDGPVPPRRPVPRAEESAPAGGQALSLPEQPRPGDPNLRLESAEEPAPGLTSPPGVELAPTDGVVLPGAEQLPTQPRRTGTRAGGALPARHPLLEPLTRAYQLRVEETVTLWLETPYVLGGASAGLGTDASGFTQGVFAAGFAVDLPRLVRDQFRVGVSVPRDRLRPGDLLFFDTFDAGRVSHVGVYAGGGKFAHAVAGKGVVYARLDARVHERAYRGARRLLVYPD